MKHRNINGIIIDENNKIIGINDRETAVRSLLYQLAVTQNAQVYCAYKKAIELMDDDKLVSFLQKNITVVGCDSEKDMMNSLTNLAKTNGVTKENSAFNVMPLFFQEEKYNDELLKSISRSHPSDYVELDYDAIDELTKLWKGSQNGNPGIPSDLFFAHTIPLLDFYLSISNGERIFPTYRVLIHADYSERIEKAGMHDRAEVGEIFLPIGSGYIIVQILAIKGIDRLVIGESGYKGLPANMRESIEKSLSFQAVVSLATFVLQSWYGIQIALLHPTVKDVFSHPGRFEIKKPGQKHKGKRRTMYVKKHLISADSIRQSMSDGSFSRNTLVWYVIGHWRTYKSGAKVFIRPYWKGPLREIKQNLDDRERIIPTGGTQNA